MYQEFGVTADWQLLGKQHLPNLWANLASHLGIGKVQFGTLSSKYNWQEYGSNCILHKSGWQPFTRRNLSCLCTHTKQSPLESPSIIPSELVCLLGLHSSNMQIDRHSSTYAQMHNHRWQKIPLGQNKEALSELRHIGGSRAHLLEFPAVPIISGAIIPLGS